MSRPVLARATTALAVAYVLVACALVGVLAWPVYRTPRLAVVVGAGAVLGVGLALLARRLRWTSTLTALAALGGYLLVAVPAAVPSRSGSAGGVLRGTLEAAAGVVVGWRRLLTLRLPVQDYQAVLAPLLAAVLVAALVATALAVRDGRWAPVAAPVLLALATLVVALGPVEPGPAVRWGPFQVPDARTTVPGLALVAVSLGWVVARDRVRRARALAAATASTSGGRRPRRTVRGVAVPPVLAVAMVGIALLAGVLVAPQVTQAAARHTLREGAEPVLAVQAQTSPLDGYRAWFGPQNAAARLLSVQLAGAPVDRLRMAVLDSYDGVHFTSSTSGPDGEFVRLPRSSAPGAASRVTVTVGPGLAGIWLPVPDGLVVAPSFTGARADQLAAAFYVSSGTGAAIDVATLGVGQAGVQAGDRYVAAADTPTGATLGEPADTAGIDPAGYPQLTAWVKAQGQPRTADGLTQLVALLRARGYLSHSVTAQDAQGWLGALGTGATFVPSYAGHSTARVEDLFASLNQQQDAVGPGASDAALVAAVGDDEQFATAVALLARDLGFESRVVLGFRLRGDGTAGEAVCTDVCTGADMAAWVEVRSPGGTWVAMDVDPQVATPPRPVVQGQEPPSNPTRVRQPDPKVVQPPDSADHGSGDRTAEQEHADAASRRWARLLQVVGLALSGLGLLVAPVLAVPLTKVLRRRARRRARVPEVAVVGAWSELADRCLDLGVPLQGPTRAAAASASGRPTATALAVLVDESVYAQVPPDEQVQHEAWGLAAEDLAAVGAQVAPWRRALAAVSPRSLLRALSSPWRGPSRVTSSSKESS